MSMVFFFSCRINFKNIFQKENLESIKTVDVLVNIKSPFIVVPFYINKASECWSLDLGDILMTYHEE